MKTSLLKFAAVSAFAMGVTAGPLLAHAQSAPAGQPDAAVVMNANPAAAQAATKSTNIASADMVQPAAAPVKVAATTTGTTGDAAPAAAGTPVFSEDFSFADSAWSLVDAHIGDGLMTQTPKPDHWSNAFYYGALFKDADVRVKARIMESSDRSATASSLAFWHADGKNFYVLTFWHDSGFIRVTRYQDGNTIAVVEKTIANFHLAPDGWVELRVTTRGNIATVFVDGLEQGKFKGQAPAQGWKIGMFASAPKTGSASVAFRNLTVY